MPQMLQGVKNAVRHRNAEIWHVRIHAPDGYPPVHLHPIGSLMVLMISGAAVVSEVSFGSRVGGRGGVSGTGVKVF